MLYHCSSAKHEIWDDFPTGDESWFSLKAEHEKIWLQRNDAWPVRKIEFEFAEGDVDHLLIPERVCPDSRASKSANVEFVRVLTS
jgi:hypothetical protein